MRHLLSAGNVHENHALRLSLVMSDNGFSGNQRDIVHTVYRVWGQHPAEKLVAYFIRANSRKEVIQSTGG